MKYKFQESMMNVFQEKGRRLAELERVVDDKQCDSQVQLQVEEYHDTQERVDQVLEQVKDALKQQDLSNLFLLISTLCDQLMQQNKINLKAQIQPNDIFQMQLLNKNKEQEILKSPKTITPKKQNNNYEPAMLTQKTFYQEQFEEKPKQKKRDNIKPTREFSTQTDFHFLFNKKIINLQQRIGNLEEIVEDITFENKLKDDKIDFLQNQKRKNGMVKDQAIQVDQNHNKINPIFSQKNIRHKSKLSQIDFNNLSQDEIQKKKNYSQFDLDQFCKNKKTSNLDEGFMQSVASSLKDCKKSNNQENSSKLQQQFSQSIQKDEDSKSSSSNMRVENYSLQNDSNSWGMKPQKDHSERQPNRKVLGQKQYLNVINKKKMIDSCYLRIDEKPPKEIESKSLVFNKIQENKNWEKKKIKIGNQDITFFKNSKTCSNQKKLTNKFQTTFYTKLQNLDSSLLNDTNRQAKFINKSQVVGKNQDSKFFLPKNRIAQNQNLLNNNKDLKNKSAQQELKFSICEAKSILQKKTNNKYNKSIDNHN